MSGAHLLYEPGNWGDILKGIWAIEIARHLLSTQSAKCLNVLDPFAGAPDYPLTDSARVRLECLPPNPYTQIQSNYGALAQEARLASTGLLIRETCKAEGGQAKLKVYELDASRAKAWQQVEGISWLAVESGEAALQRAGDDAVPEDLVLIDPYDFFDRWGMLLKPALRLARQALVLIYVFNKSPRGPGFLDQYQRFRTQLDAQRPEGMSALLGRIPSDCTLPRAFHEMVLLGDSDRVGGLSAVLKDRSDTLARHCAEMGAFEQL